MQAFSLIHAGFLAAGLAVALPIVIHLLFRQRTRTVRIGSVRFLHQVVREHRRRRRVRQWLLLAMRMLAVLLLALLFARPYLDAAYRRGLEQELVLLVDRSASMLAQDGQGQTSFDRARAELQSALSELDDNAIVHVAFCDAAGVQETPVDQLASAQTTVAATDFGLALAWAGDVLAASPRARRQIVLLSDLQRSGLPRARASLPAGVELTARDVGGGLPRNLAIESVRAIRVEIRPDSQVALHVALRNHGPLPARQAVVRCELEGPDGAVSASQPADVPAQSVVMLELPLDIQTDGLYRGQVTIDWPDALAIDNRRWVAFEARHPERLLLVDGQEGRSIFSNETYFLETALRLRTAEQQGVSRSFEVERIVWEAGEGFPRLDGYRAVVLANVRRLSDQDGERLAEFARAGGSLLIFAGDQVTPDSLVSLQARGLLPGTLVASPVDGPLAVDRWDQKHPALDCFNDPQQGDLRRLRFNRLAPIEQLADGAKGLLWASDRPIAAEVGVGRGRSIYFGVSADRDWSDFPRTRLYVPLVRQLLAYLCDQLAQRAAVSDRLATSSSDRIGIAEAPGNPGRWIVTNLDPRESSLARLTAEEFYRALGVANAERDADPQRAVLGLTLPADSLRADEIWTLVVWALLIVLAAELLLASRVHA